MPTHVLLWIIRGIFLLLVIGLATSLALGIGELLAERNTEAAILVSYISLAAVILVGVGVVAVDLSWRNKRITTLSALYFGLLLGLLFGYLFSQAIIPLIKPNDVRADWVTQPLQMLITAIFCYVCVSTLLQTKDDFRFIIPYVEFSRQVKGGRPLLLDTSVIIDGRIADICETRIIDTKLIVPRFVLQELQSIADSPDKLKRNRGRRGMDMLKRMQTNPKVELEIHEGSLPDSHITDVDQKLVALAKTLGARVVTNDFNLNKLAQLQGVDVINLNELANALKSVALPGETISVRLIKPGDQVGQGVGYLDDGTMVVAEGGRSHIGSEVTITVTSILQTPAGRMIFGRVEVRPNFPPPASASDRPAVETRA
jgi:uncharacterized protein YacL